MKQRATFSYAARCTSLYQVTLWICLLTASMFLLGCDEKATSDQDKRPDDIPWALTNFVKADSLNPILHPSGQLKFTCPLNGEEVHWESRNVLNPAAVVNNGKVYLFYRAQDTSGTSRIGLALSDDGLHFKKHPSPVLFPDNDTLKKYEWNYRKLSGEEPKEECNTCYFDGIEDPRIVRDASGRYVMTYTAYNGKTARLCIATSDDLYHWTKYGPAFKNTKYRDLWSKSGAIVTERIGEDFRAKKINGSYWMYFGDTDIFLARSDDLIHWEICENEESGNKISVMHPRMGYFDSRLVEPGPFALIRDQGILLIYNGSNAANFNDPELPEFTYAAGQALFDGVNPFRIIDRTESYFLHPDKPYERTGEVNEVCFVEGLVWHYGQWFLYYGTADSKIAAAVSDQESSQQ